MGSSVDSWVSLGNTRLSVELQRSTLFSMKKDVVGVINGEIYNAFDIRKTLEKKGYFFSTDTDAEVIVHLYDSIGVSFLNQLEGMFALALYDTKKRKVILGRDRFGMKPLYWMQDKKKSHSISFASEINPLKSVDYYSADLSPIGVSTYLGLMYVAEPWTIYENIQLVPPGCYLEVSQRGVKKEGYYDLTFQKQNASLSERDAISYIAEMLPQAVKRHLMGDVPMGTLLSSGLDSRTVSAGSWINGNRGEAFTVGFSDPLFDESAAAGQWANIFSANHNILNLSESVFTEEVEKTYASHGQPYGVWVNSAS